MEGSDIRETFSTNLRRLRARSGLSQLSLATELDLAPNFISDIECGKKWVSPETLSKLAKAFNIEPYQFFLPEQEIPDDSKELFRSFTDDMTRSLKETAEQVRDRYLNQER